MIKDQPEGKSRFISLAVEALLQARGVDTEEVQEKLEELKVSQFVGALRDKYGDKYLERLEEISTEEATREEVA